MAYTAAQVTALEAAIARGVLSVREGDRAVTYQSLDAMRKQLQIMRQEVASSSTAPKLTRKVAFGRAE